MIAIPSGKKLEEYCRTRGCSAAATMHRSKKTHMLIFLPRNGCPCQSPSDKESSENSPLRMIFVFLDLLSTSLGRKDICKESRVNIANLAKYLP